MSRETGERVETREEADVFTLLRLEYVEPKNRIDRHPLKVVRDS